MSLFLGCHLSASDGFLAMGREALRLGGNTFQFFTRNPRGGSAKELDPEDAKALNLLMKENAFGPVIAHAPYTLNPAGARPEVRDFALMTFQDDMKRMEYIPGNYYNFHPGSHVGQGIDAGIDLIADILNKTLWPEMQTTVLLETMAGKGSEVGSRFEELRAIMDKVDCKEKVGVCMDTCHVSDAGYDITSNLDGVLEEFDCIIGLKHLKALHLNDSKNPLSAHKDRHELIGKGYLGLAAFEAVINHSALKGLPMCLETPNDLDGYAEEIKLLRSLEKNK